MQVIGLCRFSYPAEGGFQVTHDTIAERRAYLYAPERIEERFASFEAITLAGLQMQTDPEFTFVVLVDADMPAALLHRLANLTDRLPQAVIVRRPPGPHRKVCQEVLNSARVDRGAPCIQFRLDDDDTVACDFVARVRADASSVAGLARRNRLVTLDYTRGVILRAGADGIFADDCQLTYYPMGMAMIVQGGVGLSVMNFAHAKVARFMPTVTFCDSAMYVRGHNDFNDSRQKARIKPLDLPRPTPDLARTLRDRFGITDEKVRQVFA